MPATKALSARSIWGTLLLVALIASIAIFFGHDSARAASFNPSGSATVADSSPGAKSDIDSTFGIDAPDSNFGATVSFTPKEWGVPEDADVTDGALVAKLSSTAVLGLLSGPCNTKLQPVFDMMDATTNRAATTTFLDQFTLQGGLPLGATKYPDYLTRVLVDQNGNALQPRARLYGQTNVSGVNVSLNFVIFEPGTALRTTQLDPALGFPSVTVLQNIGDPQVSPAPSPITDFCSPLNTTTKTFGTTKDNPQSPAAESPQPYRTNPAAGTYNFLTFAASQRDADNDGHENGLDPCPYDPDPNWDPRSPNNPTTDADVDPFGQAKGDGIPDTCDPDPTTPTGNNDHDFDKYGNRGDNCPINANGIDSAGKLIGPDNQKDSDRDGIGDACDRNPTTPDGDVTFKCFVTAVTIGAGGAAPPQPNLCDASQIGIDQNGNGTFDSLEREPSPGQATPGPGVTPGPGATPGPGETGPDSGVPGGPDTGIGSLAPAAASIPAWAAIASGLGGAGLLASLGAFASRLFRRRRQ